MCILVYNVMFFVWLWCTFTWRSTALLLRLFSKIHNQANLCRDSMTVASRMFSFDSSSRCKRVRTFGELVRWLRSGVDNMSRYLQLKRCSNANWFTKIISLVQEISGNSAQPRDHYSKNKRFQTNKAIRFCF